jgi:SAM-dependent methyltransferase
MGYYSQKLAGIRLRQCYEIAPTRVKRYLRAEIDHLLNRIGRGDAVLELGCGYGRVALELARLAGRVVGIDTAVESLALARELAAGNPKCEFLEMDALALEFADAKFDAVACVQNGICAFGVDPLRVVREALRVTRPGGRVFVSTYAKRFWPHRLKWFRLQAGRGLVGEIDEEATGEGVIVCRDGFRAGCMDPADLVRLAETAGGKPLVTEVDGSSLFCEVSAPGEIMPGPRSRSG